MKTTNLFSGIVALAAISLTACSNELKVDNPHLNEADELRYLRVAIASTPGTRADETYPGDGNGNATFDSGSADENKVTTLFFNFYDVNGNILEDFDSNNVVDEFTWNDKTGTPDPNVGKIGEAVIELSLRKGAPKPAYVIAFLNPVNFDDLKSHTNMQELRDSIRNGFKSNAGQFAMSNSAYYGPAGTPDAQKTKIMATSISEDMLYTTKAEAEKEGAKSVDIYVERYAAKVTLSIKADATKEPIGFDGYTFTFKPEAWTVNADAPSMYVSKRFENNNSANNLIPTYEDVQAMLGTWTSWNDATNHRSYWACSPSYYDKDFPNVSDNIIDRVENGTGAGIVVPPYDLRYYSYNQITDQTASNKSDGKGITSFSSSGTNYKYVLENTMGEAAFKSLNPKAAAPSVVIVGEYEIAKNGTKIENIGQGFCRYSDKIYWRGTVPTGAREGDETILKHLMDENQVLFTVAAYDEGNNPVEYELLTYDENIEEFFDVVHPKKAVRGEQNIPHRYVTLQLKSKTDLTEQQKLQQKQKLSTLYYKPVGSDSYIQLATTSSTDEQVADIITKINKQLWAQLGNARVYNSGKGYFSIPIQHLGISENTSESPIGDDRSIDWKKVRVGDFGLVRNHAYTIEVDKISGWANGIDNPDNPLVPSMDDDNYWIKYKINILNWRVVPAQTGIILK